MSAVLALILWLTGPAVAEPARQEAVDLNLVLAVDSSASVTWNEFNLQMDGLAAAFEDPEIQGLIAAGRAGAISVTLVEWSGAQSQTVSVPWATIRGPQDATAFAAAIRMAPRHFEGGGTSLSGAIAYSRRVLEQAPTVSARQVIDLSGDGRNSSGVEPDDERDAAVATDIIVNGLAILNEEPDLLAYYRRRVIGGVGAFALPAAGFEAFRQAIREKIAREIKGEWLGVRLERRGQENSS